MALSWSEIVVVSREQAKQDILELLDSVGFTATSWQEGSIALAGVEIGADLRAKLSQVAVFLKNYVLNRGASGDGLTRFSYSHYKNTRGAPVASQRKITLTCAAGEGPHSIGLGKVVATDGTHTFRNVAGLAVVYPYTLAGGTSKQFLFEAEVAGAASTVGNQRVTQLVTTFAGVTVTDDLLSLNGANEENDPRLQTRNEDKWSLLTDFELIREAVEAIARLASAGVFEVATDDQNPRGQGTFDVYIAGETTTAGVDDVTAVQAALAARVFGSDVVRTYAAPTLALDVTATVYYDATFTEAAVRDGVEGDSGSLVAFLKTIPLGGFDFTPGPNHIVPQNNVRDAIQDTELQDQRCIETMTLDVPASDLAVGSFAKVVKGTWAITYVKVTA